MILAKSRSSADLDLAPVTCRTTWPPGNACMVGTARTPYFCMVAGFSSVLSLTTSILPACSRAISSSTGATMRHGGSRPFLPSLLFHVEFFEPQRHAIVAATVLAYPDEAAQPAPEQRELTDLPADRPTLASAAATMSPVERASAGPSRSEISPSVKPSRLARRMKASRHRSASVYSR